MDSVLTNLEEYYQQNEELHHIIDFDEFKLICSSPFKFVRKNFSEGILKDIRLQYFGVFEVSGSRVKYSKQSLQKNFDNGLISERRYTDRMKILNQYES